MLLVIFYVGDSSQSWQPIERKSSSYPLISVNSYNSNLHDLNITIADIWRSTTYLFTWLKRTILDIFEIVKPILARNLEIDPETIDLEFKFHHFIDRLAAQRQQQSGSKNLLYYLEAANIYFDLAEAFELNFLADFTDRACITVADLVVLIRSRSELGS